MSKIKAFLAKPITWGEFLEFCGLGIAASVVASVVELAWLNYGITWGKRSKEEEEEEEPAYSWTDED